MSDGYANILIEPDTGELGIIIEVKYAHDVNNGAHETVGGMPTVASHINLVKIALACGYPNAVCVDNFDELDKELAIAKTRNELSMIEVKCSIGARNDLGRPTTTTLENKQNFMEYLKNL